MTRRLTMTPWLEKLTIQDKETARFKRWRADEPFAWAQREYIAEVERQYNLGLPVRTIILKARQLGISTITAGMYFNWCFWRPGTSGLIIAHENDTSESLFEKTQTFWENWPFRDFYTVRHATQRRLVWQETRSTIRTATAKNLRTGRGRTLHVVHASEFGYWDDPETLLSGLNQTIPQQHGTMFSIESTANGVGNLFHEMWEDAVAGNIDFVPMFFPWWKHYEYRRPVVTVEKGNLDDEEKVLVQMMVRDGLGLLTAYEAIEWRRWAIPNLCHSDLDYFKQEYPSTPSEAFLHTGRNVFPLEKLARCYSPKPCARGFIADEGGRYRLIEDGTGPVFVYSYPSRDLNWGQYFVGGDPTYTTQGDRACAQVLNRRTLDQVAVWHGKTDSIHFANEMAKLGYWYNNAMLCPEVEGPGWGTIGALVQMGYPNLWRHKQADRIQGKPGNIFGWSTTEKRKNQAVGQTMALIGDGSLRDRDGGRIHDAETYKQMKDFVILANGSMGCSSKKGYDDAVMAYIIAIAAMFMEGPMPMHRPVEGQKGRASRDLLREAGIAGVGGGMVEDAMDEFTEP